MKILGIGGSDHSFSACMVNDRGIVIAVEEERITREKHSLGKNSLYGHSREYCLSNANCTLDDMDLIVGNDILHPMNYFALRNRIELINHHLAHAYSAFYTLPYDKTAILVADGTGSPIAEGSDQVETVTYAAAQNGRIDVLDRVTGLGWSRKIGASMSENSLGDFYRKFTEEIGFGYLQDGKTMGLAPYGNNTYYKEISSFVRILGEGQFEILVNNPQISSFVGDVLQKQKTEEKLLQAKADIAWAAQAVLEDVLFYCLDHLYRLTALDVLCLVGGVGLNSVANGKIREKTQFKNVFIPPYTSDTGTAIGAALYGYQKLTGKHRLNVPSIYNPFLGRRYSNQETEQVIRLFAVNHDISYFYHENIYELTAKAIADGRIVCWMQEGSEMGPRALGHRSILVDPRDPSMKDLLNYRVKKREGFRPFAPAVLEQHASEYFCIDFPSPFMLFVVNVREDKKSILPAVTHVDGTARVQTVNKRDNPTFYHLIDAFYKLTGVPVILNTSFNINGEPIVETPENALNSFYHSGADLLVIGNWMITCNK